MRIGVDIDGVVANIHASLIPYLKKYKPDVKIQDILQYHLSKNNFGISEKACRELFESWEKTLEFLKMNPMQGAQKGIRNLNEQGHEIYFLTARDFYKRICLDTAVWLNNHGFQYKKLICEVKDKTAIAKALGLELMIDDNPYEIEKFAVNNLSSIVYSHPWNRHVHENHMVKRCNNWREIVRYIKNES